MVLCCCLLPHSNVKGQNEGAMWLEYWAALGVKSTTVVPKILNSFDNKDDLQILCTDRNVTWDDGIDCLQQIS